MSLSGSFPNIVGGFKRVYFPALFLLGLPLTALATPLSGRIDEILKKHHLDRGKIALKIVHLADGAIWYDKNSDLLLSPASVAKLTTAQAAMKILGPDFSFKTEFYSQGEPAAGVIQNLWIKGYGDPFFVTESLDVVVKGFQNLGIREIQGNIYADETFYDHEHPFTYLSDDRGKNYLIETGPLVFNFNTVEMIVQPGWQVGKPALLSLKHPTRYVSLQNRVKTKGRRQPVISTERRGDVVVVRGTIPIKVRETSIREMVSEPALFLATSVWEALQLTGITFQGKIVREAIPPEAKLIWTYHSPPLKELISSLGKFSNNFSAEQIFKSLGAFQLGPPATMKKGQEVLQRYLASLGITEPGVYLENGSGLSKSSRLSANHLMKVLSDIYDSPWRDDFISSLSVAGVDGTIERKLGGALRGRVFAKTGSLRKVSTLAGYINHTQDPVAFVFLFNDYPSSKEKISRVMQRILEEVLKETVEMKG